MTVSPQINDESRFGLWVREWKWEIFYLINNSIFISFWKKINSSIEVVYLLSIFLFSLLFFSNALPTKLPNKATNLNFVVMKGLDLNPVLDNLKTWKGLRIVLSKLSSSYNRSICIIIQPYNAHGDNKVE